MATQQLVYINYSSVYVTKTLVLPVQVKKRASHRSALAMERNRKHKICLDSKAPCPRERNTHVFQRCRGLHSSTSVDVHLAERHGTGSR
ncbi:hypothetical protein XELAEV_18047741mg [Xenopus laevis]|uniref:Uncharacterized protein n=1 Tax=Xenopus laevis TaxID=8355 RepID=A0A974H1T9_XENLA|nr:hypothetical protein XELAEV_18047741mg [Xenopus laevis]